MNQRASFWRVLQCEDWPKQPERFSYSAVKEIESCPRRWSLARARYPELDEPGYPRKPRQGTMAGEVAHLALQRIASALQASGAVGPEDPQVVVALRKLGGISAVLEACRDEVVSSLEGSPRARAQEDYLRSELARRLPQLRQLVQGALQRMFGVTQYPLIAATPGLSTMAPPEGGLPPGFHTEVRLAPQDLPWVGWADAVKLSTESAEIIDYKTGLEEEGHSEQLRIYALLWSRDARVNPRATRATALTVVYPGQTRPVPVPTESELTDLEEELRDRAVSIGAALRDRPPKALVDPKTCRYCDVKHLCNDYWTRQGQDVIREPQHPSLRSVQVEVLRRDGAHSWTVLVELDPYLLRGTHAQVASQEAISIREGEHLRIIDCWVTEDADSLPTIRLGATSEVFRV